MINDMQSDMFAALLTESGLIAALLFLSNLFWIGLYLVERRDRMTTMASRDMFKKDVTAAINQLIPFLEVIKDRTERK